MNADNLMQFRRGAPLTPNPVAAGNRQRPSLKRALEIAESPALVHRARMGY